MRIYPTKFERSFMQMKILILGASDFQLPAILKAKEMGLTVGVADMNPNALGVPFADEFFCVSTIDEEGVSKAAADFRADGIVTLCTDMPMRALARACETEGLVGLDYKSAVKSTDKAEMIRAFEENGVEHPDYLVWRKGTKISYDLNYPVITKPTDNSGSRGIMIAHDAEELEKAIKYSSENGRQGDIIIEEYMRGPEVSVEVMVVDSVPNILQITDKLTTGEPHFVEIGHSQPSRLPDEAKKKIADLAGRAALAVGIKNGPAHAEIILTESGPKMVEIGARMGGGCITTHLVPLSTGIDMTRGTIDIALGRKPDVEQKYRKGAAIRFIIPPHGVVQEVKGVDDARAVPGIVEVRVECVPGQKLGELENGSSRIGYVIAQADTAEDAVSTCEKALSMINIITE